MSLGRDYTTKVIRNRIGFALLATLVFFAVIAVAAPDSARADTAYDSEELQFLKLINEYRADNGAGPLILSDDLTVAGERHNEDMGKYDFFAHDTVESSYYGAGSEPWDRMAAEGYDYNTYKGENLAAGYATAEEAMQAWKDSPSHNTAMLDDRYNVVGISRVQVPGSTFDWYWTTDFGAFEDPSSHDANVPFGGKPDVEKEKPAPEKPSEPEKPKDVVKNGSFEDDSVWEQRATDEAALILNGEFVRLGGYEDGVDELRQKVRVQKDAKLSFRLKVVTNEQTPYSDVMRVRLTDENRKPVAALESYTGADAGKWRTEEIDLSDYEGRSAYLSFFVRTDDTERTRFLIDDVALVV